MRLYHDLRVTGVEHTKANQPCLIASNHSSHLDTMAILASLPSSQVNATCSAAAKDYFFSNPFVALLVRHSNIHQGCVGEPAEVQLLSPAQADYGGVR
jgi:1-acyl-sn-glycerol-3-phosphate acyltransferase